MISVLKKQNKLEYVFDAVNIFIMLGICFITLYPIWNILVTSLNDGNDAMLGPIYWWPRIFSLDNYRAVFHHKEIINSFGVTILRTIIGTITNLFFTAMVSYAISKRYLLINFTFLSFDPLF